MKKFLRRTIPLLIPILLLALFSRVPLAQPEQTVPEEARLVGYYLLPDELVPPNWESAENGWEEYSSRIAYINGLERILLPQTVLKAQKDKDGQYRFPGPEGRRFFLVQEQNMVDGNPEATVELHSDLSQDRYEHGINVTENSTSYILSGTLHYTTPLARIEDQSWSPYYVYQSSDGTVYLVNEGGGTTGAGGITLNTKYSETLDDQVTRENILDITVNFSYVPHLKQVTVEQFTQGQQSITTQTISVQQVLAGQDALDLTWEDHAAYALVSEQADDGSIIYTALTSSEEEAVHTSYFPLDSGLTTPCTITIG